MWYYILHLIFSADATSFILGNRDASRLEPDIVRLYGEEIRRASGISMK